MSKTPLTRPSSTPARSISAGLRRPSSTSIAPMTRLLPAPVAPVKQFKPRRQLDARVGDHRQVGNVEFAKHGSVQGSSQVQEAAVHDFFAELWTRTPASFAQLTLLPAATASPGVTTITGSSPGRWRPGACPG